MASKSMVVVSSFTDELFETIDAYVSGFGSDSWEVVELSDSDDQWRTQESRVVVSGKKILKKYRLKSKTS